jgi:hypothetical protein
MLRRLALALVFVSVAGLPGVAKGATELRTAVMDPGAFSGPESALAMARARAAGATYVRLVLSWRSVAPNQPKGSASDPANTAYRWAAVDAQVLAAHKAGLAAIVCVTGAPLWAHAGSGGRPTTWPKPDELARFLAAAAARYSGSFRPETGAGTTPLPRVRDWQIWNEPNHSSQLRPQFRGRDALTPSHYRAMLDATAAAIHRSDPSNRVIAGGLAPFGHRARDIEVVAPLRFMAELLCVRLEPPHRRSCNASVSFDVWSHHPYTTGGPTHDARARADVSLGDLPRMKALLAAAVRAGNVRSNRATPFWVTEFAWDTSPPDPRAVPLGLQARWVAEAIYRMWRAGVSLVTWWRLRDDPIRSSPYQSGLYFNGGPSLDADRPKPTLSAFRFPFVAFRRSAAVVHVWGRTRWSLPGPVVVEQWALRRWTQVSLLRAGSGGVFTGEVRTSRSGPVRARTPEDTSLTFSLQMPPDRRVSPFGCGGPISCKAG